MPSRWRNLLIVVSLACLAFLLWYSPPKDIINITEQEPTVKYFPSAFLTQTSTKQFTDKGTLDYQLDASEIRFYEPEHSPTKAELVEYDSPELQLFDENNQPIWILKAIKGKSDSEGKEIELIGDVIIQHINKDLDKTELSTESIRLDTVEKFAETDKPVIIRDKAGITQAIGLKANFNQQRIELLNQVKGKYEVF